eukprot:SAG31_NODE_2870_length_4974_cov_1.507282_2_plen_117_part_00
MFPLTDTISDPTHQVLATHIPGAPEVGTFSPQGDSPFGVADMVGTVWQYTTSFLDAHDRNCLTRGSSNYKPICILPEAGRDSAIGAFCPVNGSTGSHWYPYPLYMLCMFASSYFLW